MSEAYVVAAAATEMQASGVLGNLLGPSLVSKNKALLPDHTRACGLLSHKGLGRSAKDRRES